MPSSEAILSQPLDVLVIGGGQAGLVTGYHLRRTGLRVLLVDRHERIGNSWRQRYDSLRLFTTRSFSALPGLDVVGDPEGYPGKDEIADYLEAYATRFELPVRLGSGVQRLERIDGTFVATLGDGTVLQAESVIIASGAYQVPVIPAFASGFGSEVQQLSSGTYRNATGVRAGTVMVVGDGASGRQIASDLLDGHEVLLAQGRKRQMTPDRILGRNTFWWFDRLGLLRVSGESFNGRKARASDSFPSRGLGDKNLVAAGVRLVPRLSAVHGRTARFEDAQEQRLDAVVWATGYRDDTSWIAVPGTLDTRGAFAGSMGVSPAEGLFFVGRSWQTSRGSALLHGVGRDAGAIVAQVVRGARRSAGTAGVA